MKRNTILLFLFITFGSAQAQNNTVSQLAGTWSLLVVDNILPDGSSVHLYGTNPSGLLMFDDKGSYTLQIMSGDRIKFSGNDKASGTADEYRTDFTGINTHFGKYEVNQDDHTITFKIEHASYPNWEGVVQKRSFTITNGELKYTVPAPTSGANAGATGVVIWKKIN
jgi:hypothetical protein